MERRPGAARELEAYLNKPRVRVHSGTPTSATSCDCSRSFNSSTGSIPSSHTSWSSSNQRSVGTGTGDSRRLLTTASIPGYSPFSPIAEPPWLLTTICAVIGVGSTLLSCDGLCVIFQKPLDEACYHHWTNSVEVSADAVLISFFVVNQM